MKQVISLEALAILACLATGASGHVSSCHQAINEKDQFLDRQKVGEECSESYPLTGFQFGKFGCGGADMRYDYGCGNTISTHGTYVKKSGCELMRDQTVEFLDRQDPFCGPEEAVVDFVVTSCSGNDLEYTFTCARLGGSTSLTTHYTNCDHEKGQNIEYLDRLNARCPAGSLLNGFVLEGCGGDNMRYRFTCVEESSSPPPPSPSPPPPSPSSPPPPSPSPSPPPPSPSPPPPSPSPPPPSPSPSPPPPSPSPPPPSPSPSPPPPGWEDYPGTVCKQWTESEDDKDNGVYERFKKVGSLEECKMKCMEDPEACFAVEYYMEKKKCDVFTQVVTSFKYNKNEEKSLTCSVNLALNPTLTKYRKNGKKGKEYELPEKYYTEESAASSSFSGGFGIVAVVGSIGAVSVIVAAVYQLRKSKAQTEVTKYAAVYETETV